MGCRRPVQLEIGWWVFFKNLLELFPPIIPSLSLHFSLWRSVSRLPASWHFFWPLRLSLSGREHKAPSSPFREDESCSPAPWATSTSAPGRRVVLGLRCLAEVYRLWHRVSVQQWEPGWGTGGCEIREQSSSLPTLLVCKCVLRDGLATCTPALYRITCTKSESLISCILFVEGKKQPELFSCLKCQVARNSRGPIPVQPLAQRCCDPAGGCYP